MFLSVYDVERLLLVICIFVYSFKGICISIEVLINMFVFVSKRMTGAFDKVIQLAKSLIEIV